MYERALVHARRAGDEQGSARRARQAHAGGVPRPTPRGERDRTLRADPAPSRTQIPSARARRSPCSPSSRRWAAGSTRAGPGSANAARSVQEFGLVRAAGALPGFAGCVELVAGDAALLRTSCSVAMRRFARTGETSVLATTAALLAQALERQGCLDEAEGLMARERGERWAQATSSRRSTGARYVRASEPHEATRRSRSASRGRRWRSPRTATCSPFTQPRCSTSRASSTGSERARGSRAGDRAV